MLDRKNKGGKSLVLRCTSTVKSDSGCPFYAKLRRSCKDDMWYICAGMETKHDCPVEASPPNYTFVDSMMAMRGLGERPNSGFLEYTDGVNTPFSNFEG